MFPVELYPLEVDLVRLRLPNVEPAVIYDPWIGYKGMCIWPCNQSRTYGLPGEPEDERWGGLWLQSRDRWRMALRETPGAREILERHGLTVKYERDSFRGYAEAMTGRPIGWSGAERETEPVNVPKRPWWKRLFTE